jgi:hypothetical protein
MGPTATSTLAYHGIAFSSLRLVFIGDVFMVKMPVIATLDSHYCTFLGHLGWRIKNRNDLISFVPPKVSLVLGLSR